MSSLDTLKTHALTPDAWLEALAQPRHALELSTYGHQTVHAGWLVMPRAIPEHLVYLVEAHAMEGRVAGRTFRLEPGDLVWISPGVLHEMRVPPGAPPFAMYHCKIKLTDHRGRSLRMKRDVTFLQKAEVLEPYLGELIDEAHHDLPYADARRRGLIAVLATRMLRMASHARAGEAVFDRRQRRAIQDYFAHHAAKRPSPGDLARELRMNADYFARLFRKTYGLPPRAWLKRERMHLAARKLQSSQLSISEVAYELGFKDVYLFSRQFKEVYGRSPRAYRREV